MANLKLNYSYSGFSKEKILESAQVVSEVDAELMDMKMDNTQFCGWIDLPSKYINSTEYAKIKRVAGKIRSDSDFLVVIGIGGSYLGARAVIEALHSSIYQYDDAKTKVLFVGNNLSANYINDIIDIVKDKDFSINVISKSGTTTEPAIAFRIFRELIENKYGIEEARRRIFVTTDENKGALRKLSDIENYETFIIPDDVGGRFSVLTVVGLLPIAASGIDIDALMTGAKYAEEKYSDKNLKYNDCYKYAVLRNLFYDNGKSIEMLVSYEPKMHYMIEWWKQLFGESEGKDGKGLFPVGAEFTTDLHSLGQYIQDGQRLMFETVLKFDKVNKDIEIHYDGDDLDNLNYLAGKMVSYVNDKAMEGTINAHVDGGVPNLVIDIDVLNAESIGHLIYFFEKACGMSAKLLEVNPFDQPGVEKYKSNMFKLLKKPGF